jgi:hypothetical protein
MKLRANLSPQMRVPHLSIFLVCLVNNGTLSSQGLHIPIGHVLVEWKRWVPMLLSAPASSLEAGACCLAGSSS